ncbi:MAG TPA: serine/threonine-protein kinase [Polyangia bacterium]|nr:serine/threonine-protein kinase [Polyangia bacterium]
MSVGGPVAPDTEDPLLGRVLSERYRILRKLGEGGMGVVYLAEHVVIEKKIALKVLFPDLTRRADLVQRFMQEAKSASRIGHENVIDITDFGQSPEGYVFIAMEYLSGQDLGQILKASGPMPWPRAQPLVLQMVKALRAAHERGIIHRDMKPENIFVLPRDDGREFIKVLDFGIAKVMGLDDEAPRLTRTGMIFGTPEYMSPEQAQGQRVDHRVDIYAVGCIMYHILTGGVPFKADSFMGILSKHMMEAPEPPRNRNPGIDPAVELAILKAMEKDPAKRFQNMNEFVQAIAPLGAGFDMSGAISTSTGMAVPKTVFSTGASLSVPSPATGSGPVVTGVATVPSGPLTNATHEIPGRASLPLAAANPEVRRSRTEIFDHPDSRPNPGPTARSGGSTALIVVGVGAVIAAAAALYLLRGSPPTSVGAKGAPVAAPAAVAPVAPSAAPPVVIPPPGPAPKAPVPPAAPAAVDTKVAHGNGTSSEGKVTKRHRSSKDVVDSLRGQEPSDSPPSAPERPKPGVRTPDELKNPFAPGTAPP